MTINRTPSLYTRGTY